MASQFFGERVLILVALPPVLEEIVSVPQNSSPLVDIGKYTPEREIARGGMGVVYAARHRLTKSLVALKVMPARSFQDEAAYERFLGEVSAAAKIGHPGIVQVYDAGRTENGDFFIAMEMLDGESFEELLERQSMSREEGLQVVLEVLKPLRAAHNHNIVHRDLKPENVFLHNQPGRGKVVKLLDFGIARDTTVSKRTSTGISMGTPHYMSPEQATAPSGIGPASDVWSMGVMMYETLTGTMPFAGETAHALVFSAISKAHRPVLALAPEVDRRISGLVDACLSKDPNLRPKNAGELEDRLAALLSDPGVRHTLSLTRTGSIPAPGTKSAHGSGVQESPAVHRFEERARGAPAIGVIHPVSSPPTRQRRPILLVGLSLGLLGSLAAATALFFSSGIPPLASSGPAQIESSSVEEESPSLMAAQAPVVEAVDGSAAENPEADLAAERAEDLAAQVPVVEPPATPETPRRERRFAARAAPRVTPTVEAHHGVSDGHQEVTPVADSAEEVVREIEGPATTEELSAASAPEPPALIHQEAAPSTSPSAMTSPPRVRRRVIRRRRVNTEVTAPPTPPVSF